MPVSEVYHLHGIKNSTMFISQITSQRVSAGMQIEVLKAAGHQQPLGAMNVAQKPAVEIDTPQVKTILDATGGLWIDDLSANDTDLYFKAGQNKASRVAAGSSAHIRLRMANAVLVSNSIRAGNREDAVATCGILNPFDGTNAPIVPAGSVALLGTPVAQQKYRAGPIWLNTVQIPGVQNISINFGNALLQGSGDGELYDTWMATQDSGPVITFTVLADAWTRLGLNGTALTGLSVYLRKYATTGAVADGTAQHIKFAATSGLFSIDESTGANNDPLMHTVRSTLVDPDGGNNALTLNTAIAITS